MSFPRTLSTFVVTVGLALSLATASCSGDTPSPEQARPNAPLELTASSSSVLFERSPVADPLALDFDPAATVAEMDLINDTIAFWAQRAERDPRDFVALNALGGLYLRRARLAGDVADYARARAVFEQSVASNRTRNLGGLTGLAHVSVFTHQFEDARELATEALAIKPTDAYARWILGDAQLALGEYAAAYRSFSHPDALNDTLPARSRLAFIEALRGNHEAAELHWQLAIAADPGRQPEESAWVHTQTGAFYLEAGRIADAREQFDLALAALPGSPPALAGRANVAIALGQLDEAIRIYEQVIERQPLPEYAITLGELYEAAGQPERAAQQYALVVAIDQLQQAAGIATDLQVASFLVAHGVDVDAALAAAQRAYEARPGIEAADVLAQAHYRLGDYEAAKRYSDEALRLGTRRPAFLFHAALIEQARGHLDEATALLAQVQAINPRFSVAEAPLAAAALEAIEAARVAR